MHRDEDYCEICTNPTYALARNYGLLVCQDCCKFMFNYLDQDRLEECTFGGNCGPKFVERRRYFLCDPCRWNKIMKNPFFEPGNLFEAFRRHTTEQGVALPNQLIELYETGQQMANSSPNKSRPTSDSLECEICHSPKGVDIRPNLPRCCQNCYSFISYARDKKKLSNYTCSHDGNCSIDWLQARSLCGACRLRKFKRHPDFRKDLFKHSPPGLLRQKKTSTNKTRRHCVVCDNSNHVRTSFGASFCANCKQFIKKTIDKKKRYEVCRQNCQIKWKKNDYVGLCPHCRLQKIISIPEFTLRDQLAVKPIDKRRNQSPDDGRPNAQQVVQETVPVSRICSVCENPHGVSLSKYGPHYCRDCLKFIDETVERRNDFNCYHEGNSINIKVQGEHRFIMCQSCAWMKIKRDPDFNYETEEKITGAADTPANLPTGVIVCPSNEVIVEPTCNVCSNPNSVIASKRFGFSLCVRCLKLVIDTKERNLVHKCPAANNCDISWAPDKDLCGACRLNAIISGSNIKMEA